VQAPPNSRRIHVLTLAGALTRCFMARADSPRAGSSGPHGVFAGEAAGWVWPRPPILKTRRPDAAIAAGS
jgi:hypothetical protein